MLHVDKNDRDNIRQIGASRRKGRCLCAISAFDLAFIINQWRTDMLMLDRRRLLRAGSAAVGAAALAPTATAPALSRAPQAGKLAQPGFYRFNLGTIEITVISD